MAQVTTCAWLDFLCRTLQQQKLRDAFLIGVGFAISTLSSWYYGVILGLVGVVYLLARVKPWGAFLKARSTYAGLGAFSLTVLALVGPFAIPYLGVARDGTAFVPLEMADFWSASLLDFLIPNLRHPLWGDSLQALLPHSGDKPIYEFVLNWGVVTTLLALYGWRWAKTPARKGLRWIVIVSVVFSLGMTLHLVVGLPISLPVGASTAIVYNDLMNWVGKEASLLNEPYTLAKQSSVAIPLPGLLLRWFIPGMGSMRSWARFTIVAAFGAASLAGLGWDSWYRRELLAREIPLRSVRHRFWIGTVVFAALILFEFWTGPQPLVSVEPRSVDRWLAQQPGQFAIMQYPISTALNGDQMLYTRYHGKRVVFGYGTYLPIFFRQRHPELSGFPDDASLDQLTDWEVRYILVDVTALPAAGQVVVNDVGPDVLEMIKRQPRLQEAGVFDHIHVFRLLP